MNPIFKISSTAVIALTMLLPQAALGQDEAPPDPEDPGTDEDEYVTYADLIETGNDRLDARFIGLSGGIILGAEAVMAIEAAIGVDKVWPYVTFPIIGAGGGGVGGYFLEKSSPGGAVALLVLGIAFVIPTAILVSSAMAYDPSEQGAVSTDLDRKEKYSFEMPPKKGPPQDGETTTEVERRPEGAPPPEPAPETTPEPTSKRERDKKRQEKKAAVRRATAGSLVFVDRDGTTSLSVPHLDIRPAYPSTEKGNYRPKSNIAVYLPLLCVDLP